MSSVVAESCVSSSTTPTVTPRPMEITLEEVMDEAQRDVQLVRERLGLLRDGRRVADDFVDTGSHRCYVAIHHQEGIFTQSSPPSDPTSQGSWPDPVVDVGSSRASLMFSCSESSAGICGDTLNKDWGHPDCDLGVLPRARMPWDSLHTCPAPFDDYPDPGPGLFWHGPAHRTLSAIRDGHNSAMRHANAHIVQPASAGHLSEFLPTASLHLDSWRRVRAEVASSFSERTPARGSSPCLPFTWYEDASHRDWGSSSVATSDMDGESSRHGTSSDLTPSSTPLSMATFSMGCGSTCSRQRCVQHTASSASTVDTRFDSMYNVEEAPSHTSEEEADLEAEEVFLEDLLFFLQEQRMNKEARAEEQLRRVFLAACVKTGDDGDLPSRSTAKGLLPNTPRPHEVEVGHLRSSLCQPVQAQMSDITAIPRSQSGPLPCFEARTCRTAFDKPLKSWIPRLELSTRSSSASVPNLQIAVDTRSELQRSMVPPRQEMTNMLQTCSDNSSFDHTNMLLVASQ